MNYRHVYHAGSFTDVLKHVTLICLIEALKRKEKPFCYFDTHAGSGQYDLFSQSAAKTQEYRRGIEKIIQSSQKDIPVLVQQYLTIVRDQQYPHYYPGSPMIAKSCLRGSDRMVLCELQADEYRLLKELFSENNAISIHHQNGYLALKGLLPPKEQRGLILIDPPFEAENEWDNIISFLHEGLRRFATGVYAIWYPIKDLKAVKRFMSAIDSLKLTKTLTVELCIYPQDAAFSIFGSGMIIINPPWQIASVLEQSISWLWHELSVNQQGYYRVQQKP